MPNDEVNLNSMNNLTNMMENESNVSWYDAADGPSFQTRIAFAITWIIIAVAGILGNSLVIYIAIRFEKFSNVTNCFIVNLAITDILFLSFCMPLLVVQYTLEHWYFNQTFCKLLNFISFVSVLVTVLTLVTMTIDRYNYIVRPFENLKWRKPKTVFVLSLIIWLLSCTFASPFYYHYGLTDGEQRQCVLLTDEYLQKHFRIYTVTLYYFIPLTIILICYTRLLYYVHDKENKVQTKTKSNEMKWSKKRRAVTKMVAIVTLVFSICWLPITLYIMSANFFEAKTALLYYFKIIANSFAYLNSAVNPIIYAFLNRSFRTNCGSIFARPSCFCDCGTTFEERRQQLPIHPIKSSHSTTKSRFAKVKQIITTNNNRLSVNHLTDNDFSEAEFEGIDPECFAHENLQRRANSIDRSKKPYETYLVQVEANGKTHPLTTSL